MIDWIKYIKYIVQSYMHVDVRISTSYNLGDLNDIKKYTPTRKSLYYHMTSLDPTFPSLYIVVSVLRFGRACSLPEKLPSVFFPSTGTRRLWRRKKASSYWSHRKINIAKRTKDPGIEWFTTNYGEMLVSSIQNLANKNTEDYFCNSFQIAAWKYWI